MSYRPIKDMIWGGNLVKMLKILNFQNIHPKVVNTWNKCLVVVSLCSANVYLLCGCVSPSSVCGVKHMISMVAFYLTFVFCISMCYGGFKQLYEFVCVFICWGLCICIWFCICFLWVCFSQQHVGSSNPLAGRGTTTRLPAPTLH